MRHIALGAGHRWRPLLLLAVSESLGISKDQVIHAAAAMELVHCYILILDDIVDNASIRRGKKVCHEKYGLDIAMYATHTLSDLSIQLCCKDAMQADVPLDLVMSEFANLRETMIPGQELEQKLTAEKIAIDQESMTPNTCVRAEYYLPL